MSEHRQFDFGMPDLDGVHQPWIGCETCAKPWPCLPAQLAAATQRAEAAEQQAAALRETFNYLLAVADEVARGDASRSALKIAVAQIQSGVAPGQPGLAASGGGA